VIEKATLSSVREQPPMHGAWVARAPAESHPSMRSSAVRGPQLRNRAIAMRLAVLIGLVGDVRRGGDVPDRAAS